MQEALDWAMKKELWGNALYLASKMDAKTHASVMTRSANYSCIRFTVSVCDQVCEKFLSFCSVGLLQLL